MSIKGTLTLSDSCNDIVHIITQEPLNTRSKNKFSLQRISKLTECNVFNATESNKFILASKINTYAIEETIARMQHMNFKYAIFYFEGVIIRETNWEDCFKDFVSKNDDWHIMAHLLNYEDRFCPTLHSQVVAFNLDKITPSNLSEYRAEHCKFEISDENIHDDYTPLWIKGKKGSLERKQKPRHVMDDVLLNMLSNGDIAINFPQELREPREAIYLDEVEDDIEKLLKDKQDINLEIFGSETFNKTLESDNKIYVTNPDDLIDYRPETTCIDTLISPASGFNTFLYMIRYRNTIENVVWLDFSKPALNWIEYLLKYWNGKDLHNFVYKQQDFRDIDRLTINKEQLKTLEVLFNNLPNEWESIKEKNHYFLHKDIIEDWEDLLPYVKGKNVYLNTTNIFNYEINFLMHSEFKIKAAFYGILEMLEMHCESSYFTGDAPNGVHSRDKDIQKGRI